MLLLSVAGFARADELTIYEEATGNSTYVPVYGLYTDAYLKCEFVIPADELADMTNGTITQMKFYLSSAAAEAWTGTFQVFLKEVGDATISAYSGTNDATVVYEGTLDATGSTMDVVFTDDYTYAGDNLLVGVYMTTPGNYKGASFTGEAVTGASVQGYSYSDLDAITANQRNFIPKTTFTYTAGEAPTCVKPKALTVNYTGGTTAEVSWTSDAEAWVISVNGTETAITDNPYTLTDLDLGTTYEIKVRTDCGGGDLSDWTSPASFTTDFCLEEDQCTITIQLTDSYGDGWNGGQLDVVDDETDVVLGTYTLTDGDSETFVLSVCTGRTINFVYTTGNYATENGWIITDINEEIIAEHEGCGSGCAVSSGVIATYLVDCTIPDCRKPIKLAAEPMHESATLSWTGFSDSYNVQYRIPASAEKLFFDDFENGLDQWTIYTDGAAPQTNGWYIVDPSNGLNISAHSGSSVASAWSWNSSSYDADNWLITPELELQGTLKFWVRTNAGFPDSYEVLASTRDNEEASFSTTLQEMAAAPTTSEWEEVVIDLSSFKGTKGYIAIHHVSNDMNYLLIDDFGIYGDEIPAGDWVTSTTDEESIEITGLEANTEYEFQVQGVCDETTSEWSNVVSFTTLDGNTKVFTADGDWNVNGNWTPEGVPTAKNNIIISADVTIPSGVLAEANNVTLEGGSITIKDGGQLIQATNGLTVTMEKQITGYGDSTGRDLYSLITTPLSDETTYSTEVEGLLDGNYDFYRFLTNQEYEWRNYDMGSFNMSAGNGFLYANAEDQTLKFTGATWASNEKLLNMTIEYEASSDSFDGWKLVGNPFTCDAYLFLYNNNDVLDADFYKMNAAGDGFDYYPTIVKLAPGEGAFFHATESGTLYFSSYDIFEYDEYIEAQEVEADVPFLPRHAMGAFVDADLIKLQDADDNTKLIVEDAKANFMLEGRTIYKDCTWNTLCLPFNVTLEGSVLEGAIAKTLSEASISGTSITLGFGSPVSTLIAGTPYIIMWEESGDNLVNPVFECTGASPRTITATEGSTLEFANGSVKFIGYYNPMDITPADEGIYYMKADNTLAHTGKNRTLKAFRAYFEFTEEALEGARSIVLDLGDGNQATSISSLPADMLGEGDWYTVSGMKVNTLKKGVYINNGKKVVIK